MKVVAHRGYSGKYPENTIAAFDATFRHPDYASGKIIGCEIDIQLSSDGKVVLYHDTEIGAGKSRDFVSKFTAHEISLLANSKLHGEPVPLFDEFLDCVQDKLDVLVEIKDGPYDKKIFFDSIEKSLRAMKNNSRMILHSFSLEIMQECVKRFADTKMRYGILCSFYEDLAQFSGIFDKVAFVHPEWRSFLAQYESYMKTGKEFHIWTVNWPAQLDCFYKLRDISKIRAIMTDELDRISPLVK